MPALSYDPVRISQRADGQWEMSCAAGHQPVTFVRPAVEPVRRAAMRHLRQVHPDQAPPVRHPEAEDPSDAGVASHELITMAEAARILGYSKPNPTAGVVGLIKYGTLRAFSDPATGRRLVQRDAVLDVLRTRIARSKRAGALAPRLEAQAKKHGLR